MQPVDSYSWAVFSKDRQYRYVLGRTWNKTLSRVAIVGLNPSTADEVVNDKTTIRCIKYAQSWGYGGLVLLNLFAFRTPDPKVLKRQADPVGKENDRYIQMYSENCEITVAAWGNDGKHIGRDEKVLPLLSRVHFLKLSKEGCPWHPLFLPLSATPYPWRRET